MKIWLQEFLICPQCLPEQNPLELFIQNQTGDDIISGQLICPACTGLYEIIDGVAVILPQAPKGAKTDDTGYNSRAMLSAYMWSHFGDLLNDSLATDAYQQWTSVIKPSQGLALDIGCAVGRVSFELSTTHIRVIGVDSAHSFIRKARTLLGQKRQTFDLIIEGQITEKRTCDLPDHWHHERIEFVVADAMALPFRDQQFSTISAFNILEKVPDPCQHLREVNRVLLEQDALFAFSDPFSWDESISHPDLWIGGKHQGLLKGRGLDVMQRLFAGEADIFKPVLEIVNSGAVSWKIRKTENLWEHITSQFLIGQR